MNAKTRMMLKYLVLLLVSPLASGMLVKDWGTGVQMDRLIYSTRDLFQESFDFLTAAQKGVFPIADLKHNYTQVWHGITAEVIFMAYNGWLENIQLNTTGLDNHGNLRRMVMSNAERNMDLGHHSDSEHKHEMIICDSCLSIHADRVHYAYESVYHNYETSGTLENGKISALISFQLTISSGHNHTIGKNYCITELEPILLVPISHINTTSLNQFNFHVKNVGIFNFLSEHIDSWMQEHFNAVVFKTLQKKLDVSIRKMLNVENPCEKFLSA